MSAGSFEPKTDEVQNSQWHLIVSVLFVVLITIAPAIIYVQKDAESQEGSNIDVRNNDTGNKSVWSCQPIEYSQLNASVCSKYFNLQLNWPQYSTDGQVADIATLTTCGWKNTENELSSVLDYSKRLTDLSAQCVDDFKSLLCSYFYRPCSQYESATPQTTATQGQCLSLKNDICANVWPLFELYVNLDKSCLNFSGCNHLLTDTSNSTRQSTPVGNNSHNTRDYLPNNGNDSYVNSDGTSSACKAPFVVPSTTDKYGFCTAPCPPEDTFMERQYLTAFRVIAYLSLTVQYLCSFIIFYTWAKARKLWKFPHIITLVMAVLGFITAVMQSIPFIVGQKQLMCKYDDFGSSYEYGGTTFCLIQGKYRHETEY
jgi:hypothetical protein